MPGATIRDGSLSRRAQEALRADPLRSTEELVAELGVSRDTIQKARRDLGIPPPPKRTPRPYLCQVCGLEVPRVYVLRTGRDTHESCAQDPELRQAVPHRINLFLHHYAHIPDDWCPT